MKVWGGERERELKLFWCWRRSDKSCTECSFQHDLSLRSDKSCRRDKSCPTDKSCRQNTKFDTICPSSDKSCRRDKSCRNKDHD